MFIVGGTSVVNESTVAPTAPAPAARRRDPVAKKHSLSVLVVAMNEADRIRACLKSVEGLADEIIVFDGGSSDRTMEICREFTDRVFAKDWKGDGVQKQRALDKATKEWVFRIDADERMSPELKDEIAGVLNQDTIREVAFRVPWATYCFGRYLTHGENGTSHWNFFRRKAAHYDRSVVHATLSLGDGPKGKLRGRLYHDANRDYGHLLSKLNDYASGAAAQMNAKGRRGGIARALFHAAWRFIKVYVLRLGFLDGRRGLMMAILYSQYVFNKYSALWAKRRPGLPDQDDWQPPAP
jgi:glycosyltransferase involved in cell wall biosynthesis